MCTLTPALVFIIYENIRGKNCDLETRKYIHILISIYAYKIFPSVYQHIHTHISFTHLNTTCYLEVVETDAEGK